MSPQEAAELMRDFSENLCVPDDTITRKRFREAVLLAIAALEREAKAEPVAWLVSDEQGFSWATTDKEIAEFSASRTHNRTTPLYTSPPAPEIGR